MSRFLQIAPCVALSAALGCAPAPPAPSESADAGAGKADQAGDAPGAADQLVACIEREFPHARDAYTQGLVSLQNGLLLESTGLWRQSSLREVELETGEVRSQLRMDDRTFAEGLAWIPGEDRLLQLTWRSAVAFHWRYRPGDQPVFLPEEPASYQYEGEGWGLCYDAGPHRLVMSDGSSRLQVRDPEDFSLRESLEVTLGGEPLPALNELECAGPGIVYANLYTPVLPRRQLANTFVRIDSESGRVTAVVDATRLAERVDNLLRDLGEPPLEEGEVLNGIARCRPGAGEDCLLLTGKNWPLLFQVRLAQDCSA